MAENFPKLRTNSTSQFHETQRTPSRIKDKTSAPRHVIFKLQKIKDKEEILKAARGGKNPTLPVEQGNKLQQTYQKHASKKRVE